MILILFVIGILFMLALFLLGGHQSSFGLVYLGFFVMLLLGLFLMSDGLSIESGMAETPIGSRNFVSVYEVYTVQNDPIVNLLAHTFFYLPMVGFLLTTYLAFKQ